MNKRVIGATVGLERAKLIRDIKLTQGDRKSHTIYIGLGQDIEIENYEFLVFYNLPSTSQYPVVVDKYTLNESKSVEAIIPDIALKRTGTLTVEFALKHLTEDSILTVSEKLHLEVIGTTNGAILEALPGENIQLQIDQQLEKIDKLLEDADKKIEEYNENTNGKIEEYNNNANKKIEDFDINANDKIEEFDNNYSEKIEEFNDEVSKIATEANNGISNFLREAYDNLDTESTKAAEKASAEANNAVIAQQGLSVEAVQTQANEDIQRIETQGNEEIENLKNETLKQIEVIEDKATEIVENIESVGAETIKKVKTEINTAKDSAISGAKEEINDYSEITTKPGIDSYVEETTKPAIKKYVDEISKVEIEKYVEDTSKEEINNYIETTTKPGIDSYVEEKKEDLKGNPGEQGLPGRDLLNELQGTIGMKFDENLKYLNDEGTKRVGFCYLDKLTAGIFECIKETTAVVNDSACFVNFSNKENSDKLGNLSGYRLLCEGTFSEEDINKEIELFDLTNLRIASKMFPALEIVCLASIKSVHYSPVAHCTKFLHIPCAGDNGATKIADISTSQDTMFYKTVFSIKWNTNKLTAKVEKAGYKYAVFVLEHKMYF